MTTTQNPNPLKPSVRSDKRSLFTLIALVVFFLVGISGVLIAQRQRVSKGPVAPTAPESRPQAAVQQINTCTLALRVPVPTPSPTVPTPSPVIPTPSPVIPTPSLIPTPIASAVPTPSPTYSCNSRCTTTAQCQTANAAYVCSGGYCRLGGNTASTTCTYKCNSNCTQNSDCTSIGSGYTCYKTGTNVVGKCRLSVNPTSTSCAYSCPVVSTKPTTMTCAPGQTQNGTLTWNWYPVSNVTQYQVQIVNAATNQVVPEYDKGCKNGDEYYNCFQGVCTYTTYHLPGTYKARIKACSNSCPQESSSGFKTTANTTITVCK